MVAGAAGALPDAALTAEGHDQAVRLAERLGDEPIVAVYSSTARRSMQTAELVAARLRLPVVGMPALAEMHLGAAEGTTDPAVVGRTAEVLRSWVVDADWTAQVADGEPGFAVRDRMVGALETIAGHHPDSTVLVVSHVASLTVAVAALCPQTRVWGRPLPPARPFGLYASGDSWHCVGWPEN